MAKAIALILVVITVSTMLASPIECASKITGAVPVSASAYNFTTMIEIFKVAMLVPTEDCTTNIDRCITGACYYIQKALDGVVAAAQPAKRSETKEATSKQAKIAASTLEMAKATGEKKKVAAVSIAFMIAADAVDAAAPADKFRVMDETFKAAAAPIA
uniref:Pectinesterase inhibitor domain-containing protein n=1 Tax=Oryza punctata TaxID=4537 RepID=A0A0E0KMZ5_ORYPU